MIKQNILILVFTAIGFSACVTAYTPNTLIVPLHSEKGQLNANIQISRAKTFQGSYAISNKVAVQVNSFFLNIDSANRSINKHKENSVDLAIGYFTKLGESSGIFEIYGGGGIGKVRDNIGSTTFFSPYLYNNNRKLFAQINVGLKRPNFEIALANRFSNVVLQDLFIHDRTYQNLTINYWEPGLMMKGGTKNIKFITQFGFGTGLFGPTYLTYSEQGNNGGSAVTQLVSTHIRATIGIEIQLFKNQIN